MSFSENLTTLDMAHWLCENTSYFGLRDEYEVMERYPRAEIEKVYNEYVQPIMEQLAKKYLEHLAEEYNGQIVEMWANLGVGIGVQTLKKLIEQFEIDLG